MALAALCRLWGHEYSGAPSDISKIDGLRAASMRGNLNELEQLNRPAVLRLRDRKGHEFFALLTTLDNNTASLEIGNTTRTIARAVLERQWSGRYELLWRAPPFSQSTIWPGDRGPAVAWLKSRLGVPHVESAGDEITPFYDDSLVNRVKTFQLERGILPDGTAGTATLLHLGSINDPAAPTLTRVPVPV
jgi:general secretion pathway protein A